MIGEYDTEQPAAPPAEEWRNAAPAAFQGVADESAAILQNYQQHRELAASSIAAGDAFVNSLGNISRNFSSMVEQDPAAYDTARTLARNAIGMLVSAVPGDPEQMVSHAASLYGDVEKELARTAVTTLAGRDAIAAQAMLTRVGGVLPEDERASLGGYIAVMNNARNIDDAAMRVEDTRRAGRTEAMAAWGYLGQMVAGEDIAFKPGWAQAVIADKRLPPDATAALVDTQARLIQNGDEPASDPALLRRVIDGVASGQWALPDVMRYVGDGLKLSDALSAARYTLNDRLTPAQQAELKNLTGTLASAERILAKPEYGQAGLAAYEQFANWLMPQFRKEPGVLDPRSDAWLFGGGAGEMVFRQFQPRFDDIVNSQVRFPWDYLENDDNTAPSRPSLNEIYSGRPPRMPNAARGG